MNRAYTTYSRQLNPFLSKFHSLNQTRYLSNVIGGRLQQVYGCGGLNASNKSFPCSFQQNIIYPTTNTTYNTILKRNYIYLYDGMEALTGNEGKEIDEFRARGDSEDYIDINLIKHDRIAADRYPNQPKYHMKRKNRRIFLQKYRLAKKANLKLQTIIDVIELKKELGYPTSE